MKIKLFSVFVCIMVFNLTISAQTPPMLFNYSAVARNTQNKPIVNKQIAVQISILKNSATGTAVYTENHTVTTDQFGFFNLLIGNGNAQVGNMSSIVWSSGTFYLSVSMDVNGGTDFLNMGTTQLLAVPYALYAQSAGKISNDANWVGSEENLVIGKPIFTKGNGVTDIDGNNYPSVVIGNKEWMATNLKTTKFSNGDPIPHVIDSAGWSKTYDFIRGGLLPAYCYMNNDSSNNKIYGKLYNGVAVKDNRNVCPNGWHIPSDIEWIDFIHAIDPFDNGRELFNPDLLGAKDKYIVSTYAGGALKSTGTLENRMGLWKHPNTEATNMSGFSGLPGGIHGFWPGTPYKNPFEFFGNKGFWWTKKSQRDLAYIIGIDNSSGIVEIIKTVINGAISIRCVKN